MVVTVAFLLDVRRLAAARRGVVVFDRHLLDAVVALDAFYAGVDTRVHRALVRAVLPRASVTVYLEVPAKRAVDRKGDEAFGEFAVRRQLAAYGARLEELPDAVVLDGTRPAEELALQVFELVARRAR
jgi:thymidylate kinase